LGKRLIMKDWRKVIWNRSRVFLQIRVTELRFLGIKNDRRWLYSVEPIQKGKKLIINFKAEKK